MFNEEKKEFTKITMENSYGHKITIDFDHDDVPFDDWMNAFATIMIGATWMPSTVYKGMKEYAESMIEAEWPDENKEEIRDNYE